MSKDSGTTDPSGADPIDTDPIDADLETMIQLMGRMFRGMKGADDHRDAEELIGRVKDAGLGPRHVPALMALVLNGPAPVGVLARHMALSPATVSQLLGELERGGFVERRPDDRDRRRMIVSLDEAHRATIERFAWRRLRPLRTALENLGPEERGHLLNGWRVLVDSIESGRPHTPAPGRSGHGCPTNADDA